MGTGPRRSWAQQGLDFALRGRVPGTAASGPVARGPEARSSPPPARRRHPRCLCLPEVRRGRVTRFGHRIASRRATRPSWWTRFGAACSPREATVRLGPVAPAATAGPRLPCPPRDGRQEPRCPPDRHHTARGCRFPSHPGTLRGGRSRNATSPRGQTRPMPRRVHEPERTRGRAASPGSRLLVPGPGGDTAG